MYASGRANQRIMRRRGMSAARPPPTRSTGRFSASSLIPAPAPTFSFARFRSSEHTSNHTRSSRAHTQTFLNTRTHTRMHARTHTHTHTRTRTRKAHTHANVPGRCGIRSKQASKKGAAHATAAKRRRITKSSASTQSLRRQRSASGSHLTLITRSPRTLAVSCCRTPSCSQPPRSLRGPCHGCSVWRVCARVLACMRPCTGAYRRDMDLSKSAHSAVATAVYARGSRFMEALTM